MSANQAYLDAIGVPVWVPREFAVTEKETTDNLEHELAEATQELFVKALVNHPDAKFAILVAADEERAALQKAWKQLKFAWKQWHHQELPANLYQMDTASNYPLTTLRESNLLLVDTCKVSNDEMTLDAPKLLTNKKVWWQLLQQIAQQSQLL